MFSFCCVLDVSTVISMLISCYCLLLRNWRHPKNISFSCKRGYKYKSLSVLGYSCYVNKSASYNNAHDKIIGLT